MKSFKIAGACAAVSMAFAAAPASALTIALETFETGANDWVTGARAAPTEFATGGWDCGAYISSTADIATNTSPFGSALIQFRCEVIEAGANCSGGDFQGDWIGQQVLTLSYWLRHDAAIALQPYIRIPTGAPNGNNPAASAISAGLVAPNVWTQVVIEIREDNPEFDAAFGGSGFAGIFSSVSRLQPGVFFAFGETYSETGVTFDIDDVRLTAVPVPAAVWLFGSALLGLGWQRRRQSASA
jgi:hypothetical protein